MEYFISIKCIKNDFNVCLCHLRQEKVWRLFWSSSLVSGRSDTYSPVPFYPQGGWNGQRHRHIAVVEQTPGGWISGWEVQCSCMELIHKFNHILNAMMHFRRDTEFFFLCSMKGLLAFFFFSVRIRLPDDTFQVQLLHYDWLPNIVGIANQQ